MEKTLLSIIEEQIVFRAETVPGYEKYAQVDKWKNFAVTLSKTHSGVYFSVTKYGTTFEQALLSAYSAFSMATTHGIPELREKVIEDQRAQYLPPNKEDPR